MYSVRIYFSCERCDICVDLYMIYNYMLRMAFLIEFAGGFIMFFLKPSFHMMADNRYDRWDRCDR